MIFLKNIERGKVISSLDFSCAVKSTITSGAALTVLEGELIIPLSVAILRQSSDSDSSLHAFLSNIYITWCSSSIFLHHKKTELKNGRFFSSVTATVLPKMFTHGWLQVNLLAKQTADGCTTNCWAMKLFTGMTDQGIFFSKINKKKSFL